MAVFSNNGLTIAFDDIGPRVGRPVLLVHGFASNRQENWRRLGWYGAFERKRIRCLALDCRGHGESSKPHDPGEYGTSAMARDIVALMDHLEIERADLIGYSMGARLALAATLAEPKRVAMLALIGVGAKLFEPRSTNIDIAAAMETDDPSGIDSLMLRHFREFADAQGEDRFALAAVARAPQEPLERAALAQLKLPTLVVAGSEDDQAGDPQGLADEIPGARTVRLPRCDHFSAISHALCKAAVFDFLDGTLD